MQKQIESILATFVDPYLNRDLISAKVLHYIDVQPEKISIHLSFGFPMADIEEDYRSQILEALRQIPNLPAVEIKFQVNIKSHAVQNNLKGLPGIKNIIAIASGKGGVGKSTTAVNLALALQRISAKVGLLDADIYGPNQPQMLGITEHPEVEEKKILPVEQYGLKTMSIGYLVDAQQPMIWRGPMVSGALQQLLFDTQWGELDYLVIDMPPGTGDIQLTLSQKIPVSGAVIITTPQQVAVADARKGLAMFKKVHVPILGVIENMSYYQCPCCQEKAFLFGEGGGKKLAEQFGVRLLGEIPLNPAIQNQVDQGRPTLVESPESDLAWNYTQIARIVAAQLSLQAQNFGSKFPNIIVQYD